QEVDDLTVDHGGELGELIEPRLVRSPVIAGAPVLGELTQIPERHAAAPPHAWQLVGPAGTDKADPQVIDIGFGDLDPEGPDLGVGGFGTGHAGLPSALWSPCVAAGNDRGSPYDSLLSYGRRYHSTGCCQHRPPGGCA